MSKADQPSASRRHEERLAAALRDNLKRRKAQARDGDAAKPATKSD